MEHRQMRPCRKRLVMKPRISLILTVLLLLGSCSQKPAEQPKKEDQDSPAIEVQAEVSAEETEAPAVPAPAFENDLSFDGASFTFGVIYNENARNAIVMEEMTGEVLNDAQFTAVEEADESLNVQIGEYLMTSGYPAAGSIMPMIQAGDDVIQVADVYCVDAPTLMGKGYAVNYAQIPHIDLDKPYWDAGVNDSLTLAGMRYAALGDMSISTHDLTHILLFSSSLIEKNNLESPYSLVFEGKWTMDKMKEMMEAVLLDANGNGERDEGDVFGYLCAIKNVLPGFWIGAGEKSMECDENDVPALAMSDERFVSVFQKIFEMTYDNNARFQTVEDWNVPTQNIEMFSSEQALFLDCSLFYVASLRDMETDFGMLLYPKYDESQPSYCARVSYYMPPIVLITNPRLELTGAVLEEMNYRAKLHITPAYYEICLKGKYSRDPESISMLDLIFDSRVVDLGDSLFCSQIRDGFVAQLYAANKRDLASTLRANEKVINKSVENMIEGFAGGN